MDLLGGDGADYSGANPYAGLLTPQQQQQLGLQQLIATMGAIGAASRPSRLPTGLGAAMGQGALAGQQAQILGAQHMLQSGLIGQEMRQHQLANAMMAQRMGLLNTVLRQHGLLGNTDQSAPTPSGGAYGNASAAPILGASPAPVPTANSDNNGMARSDTGVVGNTGQPTGSGGAVGNTGAAPPLIGAGRNTTPGMDASGDLIGGSLIADLIGPTYSKIYAAQHPGPTDFARAYTDLQNVPAALKPLALQRLIAAAGDRYQLMRNGWAYDRVSGQWMHMPELGEGVTGTMGPNGQISASVVPGVIPALAATSKARASGPANFDPFTTYDQNGNEIVRPRTALGGGLPAQAAPIAPPLPPPPAGLSYGGAVGTGARPTPALAASPAAPGPTPAATAASPAVTSPNSGQFNPVTSLKLEDVIPPNAVIPARPAAPPGAFLGKPNPGTAEIQKGDAERLAKYQNQAAEGQKIYQDINLLSGALDRGLNTSEIAPAFMKMANIAQAIGLGQYIPKNYDPNDAGEFAKVATDLTFAALKQIPGQPRVVEIEGLQRTNPNMTLPPATNAAILHAILANQQWMDKRAELATQYMAQHPGAPLGYFDAQFNKTVPLADATDQVFAAARAAGWKFPGDKGLPSNPATPTDFSSDARANTIKQNYLKGMYGKVGSPEAKAAAEKAYQSAQ